MVRLTVPVGFRSTQESIDKTTPGGRLVFHVFAALAEFERDLIRERTQAGLGRGLGPVCLICRQRRGRAPTVELDHPPGEEIQLDWLELTDTPWGQPAYALARCRTRAGSKRCSASR